MAENKDELLQHYARMRDELEGAIAGLSDAQMQDASIDGWSVKHHLAHLTVWHEIRASEIQRISAGFDSAWRMTPEQVVAFNEMMHEMRKDLPLAQVASELKTVRQRAIDAVAAATERGLDGSLYGEAGLASSHEGEHAGWIRRWRGEKGY